MELEVVEEEYDKARKKIRAHYRELASQEQRPRIVDVFSSRQSEDTIDINGPALPGLRELPLG